MGKKAEPMDPFFSLFNCHVNDAERRAKESFIQKYDEATWKRELQPFINKGIMSIFDKPPSEFTQFFVDEVTRIVNGPDLKPLKPEAKLHPHELRR